MTKLLHSPVTVGIGGGTGSGKTTFVNAISERVGNQRISCVPLDAYYRDLGHLPKLKRDAVNFDHPDSLEFDLVVDHLLELKAGRSVEIPLYDFGQHARMPDTLRIEPRPVIIVEGILIYVESSMRDLLDIKIYVDTDPDIRFIRRLQRDVRERGRTMESVFEQYLETVRPGHIEFVEPTKRFADMTVLEGGYNDVAIEMMVSYIEALIGNGQLS